MKKLLIGSIVLIICLFGLTMFNFSNPYFLLSESKPSYSELEINFLSSPYQANPNNLEDSLPQELVIQKVVS